MGKNMENVKISVVMPIYNTEKYLEDTLDSILNQTMIDDIEVLMIDDGSCDNSRYIVEKYALDYDNFFSFHNKNMGQGQERNFGIKQARGEYIHFMDSDDYIVPTFYEELYNFAIKEDYDFAMCSMSRFTKNSNWPSILYDSVFEDINKEILSTNIFKNNSLVYDTCSVNKIIKKSFLEDNHIYFPEEKIFYEDLLFSIKLHSNANTIGIFDKDLYLWRFRKELTSVTQQRQNIENFKDRIVILDSIEKYLKENNINKEIIEASHLKWLNHDLFLYIKEINNYSTENQKNLINGINKILNYIPKDTLDKLNSDKKILYKLIEDNDIDSLSICFKEEKDLISNPKIINILDKKYQELADFKKDSINEKPIARYVDIKMENKELEKALISTDENKPQLETKTRKDQNPDLKNPEERDIEKNNDLNIYIETYVPYDSNKEKSKIEFNLIESVSTSQFLKVESIESSIGDISPAYKYEVEGNNDNLYKFTIPYEVIKTLNGRYNILVKYENEGIEKTCLLTTNQPKKYFTTEDVEIFSRFGLYRIFNLDINPRQNSTIKIKQIDLRTKDERNLFQEYDKEFNIKLESNEKIDSLILEHLVTFKKIDYKTKLLSSSENNNIFEINVPFEDILEFAIRKWELKTKNNMRIQIEETYKYKDDKIKINIKNQENRLFILVEYYNKLQEIEKLENTIKKLREKNKKITNKNKILADKNQKLKEKNKDLKNTINEFKSRKVIRLIDKFKF